MTYSCCHKWIVTANQWPFTHSGLQRIFRTNLLDDEFFYTLYTYSHNWLCMRTWEHTCFYRKWSLSLQTSIFLTLESQRDFSLQREYVTMILQYIFYSTVFAYSSNSRESLKFSFVQTLGEQFDLTLTLCRRE